MKKTIRLTESELERLVRETIDELGIDKWGDDDFVTNDDFAAYSVDGDMRDRNLQASMKKGLSFDQLCPMCFKPLANKRYKQLYWQDPNGDGCTKYFAKPGEGRTPINVGNTCIKHFEKAHSDKYPDMEEAISRAIRKYLR